jgi:hypothetical protein
MDVYVRWKWGGGGLFWKLHAALLFRSTMTNMGGGGMFNTLTTVCITGTLRNWSHTEICE